MVHAVENKADFTSQLEAAGGKLVVVDFHATWCGPCKMIAPHLEEMDKTMDDVVFLKVDVDECEDIAEEYHVVHGLVHLLQVWGDHLAGSAPGGVEVHHHQFSTSSLKLAGKVSLVLHCMHHCQL